MFGQSARFGWEIKMNQNDGKMIISIYNLYALFFFPRAIFMASFWPLEIRSSNSYGRGGVTPIAVLMIFLPEVIFGLSWNLNCTFGGRIFTILSSVVVGWTLNRLFYRSFMVRTYAPITYYTENVMLVAGIIWTAIIEFNQNLRNHLLLYPPDELLAPHSEDEIENSYWYGYSHMLFWVAVVLMFAVVFRII